MIDSHTHIGQFNDLYIDPEFLVSFMRSVGVNQYAVSSTTICSNAYKKVLDEMAQIIELAPQSVIPVLWLTQKMLMDNKEALFLDSPICWGALKIHPSIDIGFWQEDEGVQNYIVEIAMDQGLPIIIHTGEKNKCEATNFEKIIKRFPAQTFVLAHGRPLNQALFLVQRYSNAFIDTAFMSLQDILYLISKKVYDRILWGTDSCIQMYYRQKENHIVHYQSEMKELLNRTDADVFDKITYSNAKKIFRTS